MKVTCFHHNDTDGRCAAAIVLTKYPKCELIEMDYKTPFPFDAVEKDEKIFIVDFSLQVEGDFEKLHDITQDIVWIDHHVGAIELHKDMDDVLDGIRSTKDAGCVLTWEYLFPDTDVPMGVALIGDRDNWTFALGKDTVNEFFFGLEAYDQNPKSKIWDDVLTSSDSFISKILEEGAVIIPYKDAYAVDYLKAYGFNTKFEGYNCVAVNMARTSSDFFKSVHKDYDIFIAFCFTGDIWTVSLYSLTVDVSKVAQKYKGNGHKGASGFQCDKLPFTKEKK